MECSGVTVSQILSNHSIVTVQMEEKASKTLVVVVGGGGGWGAHGQTKSPDLSLEAPKSFYSPNGQPKNPRPHLLTFGYY